jgi:hypothetical protein
MRFNGECRETVHGRENAGWAVPEKWEWWDGNLPDTGMEDILWFAVANGIVRILADIPGRGELPEQYGRLGFHRAYLYRCYQKKQEEKSYKEQED